MARTSLRDARCALGLTALRLGEALGITELRVYAIERGRARPTPREVSSLMQLYSKPVEALFPGEKIEVPK